MEESSMAEQENPFASPEKFESPDNIEAASQKN